MKFLYQLIVIIFSVDIIQACSVCAGAPDEPAVKAAKLGILFLLGVVGLVLSGFMLFIFNLIKKSKETT